MSEVYRKIRNTARYILGNLSDFNPETDSVSDSGLTELDRWALSKLDALLARATTAYERFDFHIVYHAAHNFCTVDMSNFYLDVLKDRLYVEAKNSLSRRAAQTAIYRILRALVPLIAPLIPFTAEEIWSYLPKDKNYDSGSVMFNDIPKPAGSADPAFAEKWDKLIAMRYDVNKALENERIAKRIGKSLEAKVILGCDGALYDLLEAEKTLVKEICIVSQVELKRQPDVTTDGEVKNLSVSVAKADGQKCERCWAFSTSVGESAAHPALCARCAGIIG
jgi:isoleucyl-tRNA synthetase